jgi:hypothetical protein
MNEPIEFWHVQLPDGSVSTMTLDELDTAFQCGRISEKTYVLKQGDSTWATLASLLGLDEAPPLPPARAPVAQAYLAPSTPGNFADFAAVNSLRPVVSDVDDDELDFGASPFRRRSKKRAVAITASVLAIAAVGAFVATFGPNRALATLGNIKGLWAGSSVAAASQPPPAAVVVETPPAPPPPAADPTPAPAPDRFDDAKKRALLEADKARDAQQKAKMNAAPAHRSSGPGYKSDGKPVFHKGGNKFDPLNASL